MEELTEVVEGRRGKEQGEQVLGERGRRAPCFHQKESYEKEKQTVFRTNFKVLNYQVVC